MFIPMLAFRHGSSQCAPMYISINCHTDISFNNRYRTYFIRCGAIPVKTVISSGMSLHPNVIAKRVENAAFKKPKQLLFILRKCKSIRNGFFFTLIGYSNNNTIYLDIKITKNITYNAEFRTPARLELFYEIL